MFKFFNDNKKRKVMIQFSEEIVGRKNKNIMENQRSDLDQQSEAETHNTKISDSGYSTGCSNSQSQRSGSSKSIHSNSGSSNSSGYEGLPTTAEEFQQPHLSKSSSKSKDHKKKKTKSQEILNGSENINNEEKEEININDSATASKKNTAINSPLCLTNINNSAANIVNNNFNNNIGGGKTINLNCNNINGETVNQCEVLHLATVAQTLKCVKKMRGSDGDLETNLESLEVREGQEIPEHLFDSFNRDASLGSVSGQFCLAVSMQDGKVLYTTPSLTDTLGFPCDMWIGRSFIDFIHHKDRVAFANHITVGVAGPMISNSFPSKNYKNSSNTFFCSLRKYRGLKTSGFGVKDKAVEYVPFKLSLSFKEITGEISDTLLVITAAAVKTAYNRPNEIQDAPKFVTRHLANTLLSHIDIEAVSYLGYLPQDMIGRSVFDFYHPEDMPLLKEIYESVLEVQGSPYRSKPYRFRTQNGEYVLLETEWSSFINPWSNKLEFTIGLHRLLRGPLNPDVFAVPTEHQQISDEHGKRFKFLKALVSLIKKGSKKTDSEFKIIKENKIIQEEIKRILNEPVCRSSEFAKQQVSKKCKDLATFMESIMDRITRTERGKVEEIQIEEDDFSERDSVMLGEISPHHDYCDSKSSSETPPSYNQLNYNENLQRFFQSKPRTLTSSDAKNHSSLEEEGKTSPEVADNSKCRSPNNGSGTCSGSGSGLSSTSNCITGTSSTETNTSKHQDYCEPVTVLTEAILSRHNEDMEKVLIKRHRDLRIKDGKINKVRLKTVMEKLQDHCHGVKRSGSLSWEGDKVSKHRHTESNTQTVAKNNLNTNATINRTEISIKANGIDSTDAHIFQGGNNINLWPPFSVTTFNQSVTPNATYTTGNGGVPVAGMIPIYYITTGGNPAINPSNSPYTHNNLNINGNEVASNEKPDIPNPLLMGGNTFMHQVQFLNAFPVYSAVGFGTPSVMYSPLMMAPQAPLRPHTSKIKTENENRPIVQRPASQATSVKAEPGSAIGSMVLSECSKKEEKSMGSPEIEDSLCFSQDEEKPKEISGGNRDMGTGTGDESSYSSYSSYIKTEDSMRSSEEADPGFSRKSNQWLNDEKGDLQLKPIRKEPPWLQEINFTPELVFRYQLNSREITNVLDADLQVLKTTDQPKLVDDQLQQLYLDMEHEGLVAQLKLEEGPTTSSCSSGEELQKTSCQKVQLIKKKKKKQHDYTQLVMIYEENMPLPSPRATAITN